MLVTNQSHMLITFGLEHVDRQLEHLAWTLDYVERTNKILQTANLMVEHNTPVTFAPSTDETGSETPQVPPAAATPRPTPTPAKKPEPARPNIKPIKTPVPVRRAVPANNFFNGQG